MGQGRGHEVEIRGRGRRYVALEITGAAREWAAALGLALLAVGGAVAVAYASGAMGTPYGDDWDYSRVVFHLYDTGNVQLTGWESMNLMGHLLWGLPFVAVFGKSQAVLDWSTAVAAVIGLVASFAVLRRFLSAGRALFGTALVAILPVYASLATTYMTDMTAFAASMVCLALGLSALDARGRRRWTLLAVSLAIGLFGFAGREIAIAAPAAVLAAHLVAARRDGASLWHMVWPPAALAVAAGAFLKWRHGLPGQHNEPLQGAGVRSAFLVAQGYFTLALGVLPALVAGVPTAWRRRFSATSVVGATAALALTAFVAVRELRRHDPLQLPLGEAYGRAWKLSSSVGVADIPPVFLPGAVWAAIDLAAVVAGVLLGVLLARAAADGFRRIRSRAEWDLPSLLIALFGLLYAIPLAIRALQGALLFDRYFVPLTVPVLVLALRRARLGAPAFGTAAVVALLTVVIAVHEIALRGALWKVGQQAVAEGAPARAVDAGLAWVGSHYTGPVGRGAPSPSWKDPAPWYAYLFPNAGNCLATSMVPLSKPQLRLVTVRRFRWIPGLHQGRVWLYRKAGARCAGPG